MDPDRSPYWQSDRTFSLNRYGIGHSQLLLLSRGSGRSPTFAVHFEAVTFMKLHVSYPRLALRPARAEESAAFEGMDSSPFHRLGVVLDSPEHTGLVACGRVTVRQSDADDGSSWGSG